MDDTSEAIVKLHKEIRDISVALRAVILVMYSRKQMKELHQRVLEKISQTSQGKVLDSLLEEIAEGN